jgi:hypothetical protein
MVSADFGNTQYNERKNTLRVSTGPQQYRFLFALLRQSSA